jgi:tripartite-type tricarboxylate transporter receptor subunit TctC
MIALAALMIGLNGAAAQQWPSRQPIRVIVPLPAGTATDIAARILFEQVSSQVGQAVVVENRVGAGGTLGTAAVAKAEPDGYTVLFSSATLTVMPSTFANLPFNVLTDLVAVSPVASIPTIMVVSPAKGYKSLQDFVAAAKAKPGAMNFASAGVGNSTHFAAERFRLSAGVDAVHIPFKGGPEALTEVMTNRVDFYCCPIPPALSLVREGKLQALATGSARRSSILPEVPTTLEAGYPESNYEFWVGVFLPAATPKEIVERLSREIGAALQNPTVRSKLNGLGADPMAMTPAEFGEYVRKEVEMNAALVKAIGIKAN